MVNVFGRAVDIEDLAPLIEAFEAGLVLETGAHVASADYRRWAGEVDGLAPAIARLGAGDTDSGVAAAVELLLEGLHLNRRLNKDRTAGGARYRG